MKNRIIEIRKDKKLNQEEFANKLNLSRNFINQIESGKKNPSDRTIIDICKEFKVNEEWLRNGEGEMYLPIERESEIANLTIKLLSEESDSFKNRLVSALSRLSEDEWELLERMFRNVVDTEKE